MPGTVSKTRKHDPLSPGPPRLVNTTVIYLESGNLDADWQAHPCLLLQQKNKRSGTSFQGTSQLHTPAYALSRSLMETTGGSSRTMPSDKHLHRWVRYKSCPGRGLYVMLLSPSTSKSHPQHPSGEAHILFILPRTIYFVIPHRHARQICPTSRVGEEWPACTSPGLRTDGPVGGLWHSS